MSPPRSVLELFHAEGRAPRIRIVGSACPADLCTGQGVEPGSSKAGSASSEAAGSAAAADLLILAPDLDQGDDSAWLRRAACRSAVGLAPHGIVYSLAAAPLRRKLRRWLRAEGLDVVLRIAHRPHWKHTRYLVPLRPAAVRYAFSALMPSARGARSYLTEAAFRAAVRAGIEGWLPGVAEVFGRPGERQPMAWLSDASEKPYGAVGVVRVKVGGGSGRAVIHCMPAGAKAPTLVLKIALGPGGRDRAEREGEALARLGATAEKAGARLPRIANLPSRPELMAQTVVSGRPASVVLSRRPSRLAGLLVEIAAWLGRWHAETRHPVRLDQALLHRLVLSPAANLLDPEGAEGAYLEWIEERARGLEGRTAPLVATHNDLTMENVIVADGRPPGVVDWAGAEGRSLPLGDFYYAAVDAVTTAAGHGDRVRAVRDCFTPGGRHREHILQLEREIAASAGVTQELAVLCFHACWLRHAESEISGPAEGRACRFRRVIRWQASRIAAGRRTVEPPRG